MRRLLPLLALLLLAAGCGQGGAATPREVVHKLKDAAASRDFGAIYNLLSDGARERVDRSLERAVRLAPDDEFAKRAFGRERDRLLAMSGRERFEAMARAANNDQRAASLATTAQSLVIVGDPQVDGERASIVVRDAEGTETTLHLVRERGAWRIESELWCGAAPDGSPFNLLPLLALLLALVALRRRRLA